MPSVRSEEIRLAFPCSSRLLVPNSMNPSMKVTLPVGISVAGNTGFTAAENVTGRPKIEGLVEDTISVAEEALFTI